MINLLIMKVVALSVFNAMREHDVDANAEIIVSQDPVLRNRLWDAVGVRVPFPEGKEFDSCYVALIDPRPTYRWGHGAWFAFIPINDDGGVSLRSEKSVVQKTDMPPHNTAGGIVWSHPMPWHALSQLVAVSLPESP